MIQCAAPGAIRLFITVFFLTVNNNILILLIMLAHAPISVLIASRHDDEQKRIKDALPEQDFSIAGLEKEEAGIIIRSERLRPDVLILDLQLPVMNYLELVRVIRRRSPSTAIVILSEKNEENLVYLMFKAGSSGFLLKEEDIDKLAPVVKIIYLGGCFISASIFSALISQFSGQITEQKDIIFSPVERGIVTGIANGLSDNQIAKHLNYSAGSIKNILTAIKRRTNLKNRVQIVVFALVSGLIHFENLWMWKKRF